MLDFMRNGETATGQRVNGENPLPVRVKDGNAQNLVSSLARNVLFILFICFT